MGKQTSSPLLGVFVKPDLFYLVHKVVRRAVRAYHP